MIEVVANPFAYRFDPEHVALAVIDMQRDFLEPGGFGEALGNDLAPVEGELVIDKPGKGMFYATGLDAILKQQGITHLVFAGVTTEVCVQTSMREANDRGYECLLVENATASYFPHFKTATIEMIRAQGAIVGWTTTLAQLAGALA